MSGIPPGTARSFLKWAGGKTRYAAALARLAPPYTGRYWEPFMGSAALFFELAPRAAVLADANEELVACFQEVAEHPYDVTTPGTTTAGREEQTPGSWAGRPERRE